ncbi:NAD(P)-dependent alcohol dehydrogenase [Spongiactinospora sp. TRM90649]|uniref:NAD(P)-dependent alcohol dehydrogenase n=1 Tax=Spongiactinospora sp. TRM90649 TaxID=3031114 RepID=UPI0023F84F38|nr:NAD(P)-dependent alcohol dehydrogenase [Spongiactinospora sp. TRM90649]MDF5756901.1 NAD(P)-dependent alcohol dehydrogenase [Spongiactinospora sp. TRM90649]
MKVTAAVVDEVGGPFRMERLDLDEPGPGEALVKIVAAGVCHTDEITRHGDLPMPFPGVLGHEGAGEVVAVGEGVTAVRPGDHVVIGWPSCGTCRNCRDGEPRYCARLGEALCGGGRLLGPRAGRTALRREDGSPVHSHFFGQSSFADHALTWADALVVVPKDAPLDLLGPLACGISTGAGTVFNTVKPGPGASLVVYGVGAVGLAAVMAARLSPATTVIAVDRHPARLALAREFGATHTVDAAETDPVAEVHRVCGGPADYALECTGVISVVRQAADSVGMLGTCVLVGGAPAGAEFGLDHLSTLWGKRIVGALGGGGRSETLIGTLVELHRQGRFPFDRLVRFYEQAEIEKALEASRRGEVIKPVLRMNH